MSQQPCSPKTRLRRRLIAAFGSAAVAFAALAVTPTPAQAAILPESDALEVAKALAANPIIVETASLTYSYDCTSGPCPTGVSDSNKSFPDGSQFPAVGTTGLYAVLSTGDARSADLPNNSQGTSYSWGKSAPEIGPDVYDATVLKVDLAPANFSCLSFKYKFLSEEYPEYVGSEFNDAFVAQVDTFDVKANGDSIVAPGNIAVGSGDSGVVSVNAAGIYTPGAEHAAATTYDAATRTFTSRVLVGVGQRHSVYFTIFDQGDDRLDSAVFIDALQYEPLLDAQCKSLTPEVFEAGSTGVSTVPGWEPTLSPDLTYLDVPVVCNLPPGSPVVCPVQANSYFANGQPKLTSYQMTRSAAEPPVVSFATGSASIAPGEQGTLRMYTTAEGVKSLKKLVKTFKKQAKRLSKQAAAKIRKAAGAKGKKAKQLKAEAKELKAQAKAATKKVKAWTKGRILGEVTLTLTNPTNQASESMVLELKDPTSKSKGKKSKGGKSKGGKSKGGKSKGKKK